jgi:ABC-type uncharacterized transport system YnjBCD permease subunit
MKIIFRPFFLGLFVFWIFFPFLSIIIWSVAAGWRFPDILPEEYSASDRFNRWGIGNSNW